MTTLSSPLTEPIPFEPIAFLDAKRVTGLVLVPEAEKNRGKSNSGSSTNDEGDDPLDLHFNASTDMSFAEKGPPALQRKSSLNGNILWIGNHQKAFFLQRKIGNIAAGNGSIRVGFALEQALFENDDEDDGTSNNFGMGTEYDVIRSDGPYPFEMVAIKVQNSDTVMGNAPEGAPVAADVVSSAKVELAALQLIAKHYTGDAADACHVDYCHYICLDRSTTYAIGPFYGEGSLFQYVVECGTLSEPIARHFFKQILMVSPPLLCLS